MFGAAPTAPGGFGAAKAPAGGGFGSGFGAAPTAPGGFGAAKAPAGGGFGSGFGAAPTAPGGFGAAKAPAGGGFGSGFGAAPTAPGGFGAAKAPAGGGFGSGFGAAPTAPGGFGAAKAPAGGGFGSGFGMSSGSQGFGMGSGGTSWLGAGGGNVLGAAPIPPPSYPGIKGPGNHLEWVRHVDPSQLSDATLFEALPTALQQHLVALRRFMEEEKDAVGHVRSYFQNAPPPSTSAVRSSGRSGTSTLQTTGNPNPLATTTTDPTSSPTPGDGEKAGGNPPAGVGSSAVGPAGERSATSSPRPSSMGSGNSSYAVLTRRLAALRGGPKAVDMIGVRCRQHEEEAYQLSSALDIFDQEIRLYERKRWGPVSESWRQAAFTAGKKIGEEESGRGTQNRTGDKNWAPPPAPPLSSIFTVSGENGTDGQQDGDSPQENGRSSSSPPHTLQLSGFPFFKVVEGLSAQMDEMGETLSKLELTLLPPGSSSSSGGGGGGGGVLGGRSGSSGTAGDGSDGSRNRLGFGMASPSPYGMTRRAAHAARAKGAAGAGVFRSHSPSSLPSFSPMASKLDFSREGMLHLDPESSLSERYHSLHGSLLHELELFTHLSQWAAKLQRRCDTAREMFARQFGESEAALVFREVPSVTWSGWGGGNTSSGGGNFLSSFLPGAGGMGWNGGGGGSTGMGTENRPSRYLDTAPSAPIVPSAATGAAPPPPAATGGFGVKTAVPGVPAATATTAGGGGFGTGFGVASPPAATGGFGVKTAVPGVPAATATAGGGGFGTGFGIASPPAATGGFGVKTAVPGVPAATAATATAGGGGFGTGFGVASPPAATGGFGVKTAVPGVPAATAATGGGGGFGTGFGVASPPAATGGFGATGAANVLSPTTDLTSASKRIRG